MKNFLLFSTLFAALFFVVNCSPKANNTAGTANATINSACPAGSYYSNGQCYNGNGQVGSSYDYSLGFWADNYSGYTSLQVTNVTLMKQLYKLGMGVCDLASNNYGLANCDSYIQGQTDIIMQLPSNFSVSAGGSTSALITVFARPAYNPYYNYQASGSWWSLVGSVFGVYIPDTKYYSGAYRNPLQIQSNVSMINNNSGYTVSGYGDAWTGYNNTLITIDISNGNENSAYADFVLKIGGQEAARGRMSKCQTLNCGI